MMRTLLRLLPAVLALLVAGCTARTASQPPSAQPNVLFVLVDDLGFRDFSIMGNREVATPNIDRLAREGMLLTQFYMAAPICSPSRAAFMTGRFPAEQRFVSFISSRAHNREMGQADWLPANTPVLPRALSQAGYATGHFGKWHLGGGRDIREAPLPTDYGFDESLTQFEGLGPRVLLTENSYGLAEQSAALGRGPIMRAPKAQLTAIYVDRTLEFVERHRDRPWYAQLWLDDVHDPWHPSAEQLARVKGLGDDPDERRFFAVLVEMDRQIGRLMAELEARGELPDTLVVLTGDNGPVASAEYYEHGQQPPGDVGVLRGRKASLYEGGIREPLIVRWPGRVPRGVRDATTVAGAVDLWPTIAEVARAEPPAAGDGVSLWAAWAGTPARERPDLLFAYGGFGEPGKSPRPHLERDRSPPFAIRSGDWKLLARGDGSAAELYDLARDPGETRDLAAAQPDVVQRLGERLAAWRRSLPQ